MNVWSPLTRANAAQETVLGVPTVFTSTSNCGTYSPSSPWQKGVALPADGVIYVQSLPSNVNDPNYWSTTAPSGALVVSDNHHRVERREPASVAVRGL